MASETPRSRNHHDPQEEPSSTAWVLDFGNVDRDRPRILNETIVGPNCGGGNPTVYVPRIHGNRNIHEEPPRKRKCDVAKLDDADSSNKAKRVKVKHTLYTLGPNNEFWLNKDRDADEKHEGVKRYMAVSSHAAVNGGSSYKSSIKSVTVDESNAANILDFSVSFAGGWAILPVSDEDEGYHTDPSRRR